MALDICIRNVKRKKTLDMMIEKDKTQMEPEPAFMCLWTFVYMMLKEKKKNTTDMVLN